MPTPIDVKKISDLLEYRPDIGGSCLVWKVSLRYGICVGDMAGHAIKRGYWLVKIQGKHYFAHRLVWALVYGEDPIHAIDHINGLEAGNAVENLRLAPRGALDNGQNTKKQSNNSSGYTGVYWYKTRWRAQIKVNGRTHHLGMFNTPEEAYAVYLKAKTELHVFNPVPRR